MSWTMDTAAERGTSTFVRRAVLVCWSLTTPLLASADSASQPGMFTDFTQLQRPSTPNTWLIAPRDAADALDADDSAPEFSTDPQSLATAWQAMVTAQPRTRILGVSDDGLRVEAEQHSALFGFVDRISFTATAAGEDRATFYAYSRSQVGYWDLGVNRRRLRDWVAALSDTVDASR